MNGFHGDQTGLRSHTVNRPGSRGRSLRRVESTEGSSSGLIFIFGEIFLAPLRAVVNGMEMLLDAMRGTPMRVPPEPAGTNADAGWDLQAVPGGPSEPPTSNQYTLTPELVSKELPMLDKDLSDEDVLKLVRYKILFIKRDYEHAFEEREDLVADPMDASAFTAWKVAEFIQSLGNEKTPVPDKWKDYPEKKYRKTKPEGDVLIGFDSDDKKYLRVYYEVLDRFPREKFKHDEEQIKVLNKIHVTLQETKHGISG